MLPFSIGFYELVVIVTVLLLVVGPKGIPQLARTLGYWIRTLRKTVVELQELIAHDEVKKEIIEPWQEVVRAKDDALSSVKQVGQKVLDIEPVTATLYEPSREGEADDLDQPSSSGDACQDDETKALGVEASSMVEKSEQGSDLSKETDHG